MLNDIADANHRHEELQSAIGDADITKKKLAAEKTDLDKQIADADATVRSLGKLRTSLSTQVKLNNWEVRLILHYQKYIVCLF